MKKIFKNEIAQYINDINESTQLAQIKMKQDSI